MVYTGQLETPRNAVQLKARKFRNFFFNANLMHSVRVLFEIYDYISFLDTISREFRKFMLNHSTFSRATFLIDLILI